MTRYFYFLLTMILIINNLTLSTASAYSYGDPGEEQFAEAYKEIDTLIAQGEWDKAKQVYLSYEKDFDLYFTKTKPFIDQAFEVKNEQLLLESYQAALRLNIERRLHFAEDAFDDYGQAKLLLAKARGTYNVLAPIVANKEGQTYVDEIYHAYDEALTSLGNPGLFGIGSEESNKNLFTEKVNDINKRLKSLFPVPTADEDESHLTEENLNLNMTLDEDSNPLFLWLSIVFLIILIIMIFVQRRKK